MPGAKYASAPQPFQDDEVDLAIIVRQRFEIEIKDPPSALAGFESKESTEADRWSQLVGRIQTNDPGAEEELYALLQVRIRRQLLRLLGPKEMEDRLHDTFLHVVLALRKGDLRKPEKLFGFIRVIARRQIAQSIRFAVSIRDVIEPGVSLASISDRAPNPEQLAIFRQHSQLARKFVANLSRRDREIIVRFYIDEQAQTQICREMTITDTQFRVTKSRAKARLTEIIRDQLHIAPKR